MKAVQWIANTLPKTQDKALQVMAVEEVEKARHFHQSFPMYQETPLAELRHLATHSKLGGIFIKAESYRFGRNAVKVRVVSYSLASHIA